MDGVITWLIAMKPLWFLAAWLASSVFGAFVALEKNRCGLCWFAMGVLFGPLALITTAGLPVKPPRTPAPPKPDAAANHAQPPSHAPLGHGGPSHPPSHAPSHASHPTHVSPVHPAGHHPAVHGPAAHGPATHAPHGLSTHPAVAHVATHAAHATAPHAHAHHGEPAHQAAKPGFLASALERPAAGVAIAAVVVLLLLLYFGSLHF